MADQIKNSVEPSKFEATESVNVRKTPEAQNTVPKQHFEATFAKAAEFVEAGESAEVAKEVSEAVSNQSEQKGDGLKKGGQTQKVRMTPAQIKAQLLQRAPSQEVMTAQVKKEIDKEIKYLSKRARKAVRKAGAVNAFELNNIVKKIRDLKSILVELAKAAFDTVKTLWLRFVHGVM